MTRGLLHEQRRLGADRARGDLQTSRTGVRTRGGRSETQDSSATTRMRSAGSGDPSPRSSRPSSSPEPAVPGVHRLRVDHEELVARVGLGEADPVSASPRRPRRSTGGSPTTPQREASTAPRPRGARPARSRRGGRSRRGRGDRDADVDGREVAASTARSTAGRGAPSVRVVPPPPGRQRTRRSYVGDGGPSHPTRAQLAWRQASRRPTGPPLQAPARGIVIP